jgi:hypothetical protein
MAATEHASEPRAHVGFLLEKTVVARVRDRIPLLSVPWRRATLSDAFRQVVLAGLDSLDRQAVASSTGQGRSE